LASFAESISAKLAWVSLRLACRLALRRIDLHIEGLSHIPRQGPAILAARHFHHLWDGCALIATLPRPLRVVVALDWLEGRASGRLMAAACGAAGWPVVPRPEAQGDRRNAESLACLAARGRGRLLAATRESISLLRADRMLLVFPEGYPTIDPHYTPKTADDEILPFQPGFLHFAALAERDGVTRVPIIPVGLEYARGARWQVTVRFGQAIEIDNSMDQLGQLPVIEQRVRELSGLAT